MRFTKMHGCGNDYVFVDCFQQPAPESPGQLAKIISDRHRGVGSDGLILIEPSQEADARMRMWNADGSRGEMCGNGLRCVGKYLFDRKLVADSEFQVATDAGLRGVKIEESNGGESRVRVAMGRPILAAADIPTTLPGNPPTDAVIQVAEYTFPVTCVSMGNPHCVLFVDEPNDDLVLRCGPLIEHHTAFPQRTNVEFVKVVSQNELRIRVWERGSGETQACGTGACAAVVAAVLKGFTSRTVDCHLPGGTLTVEWDSNAGVLLAGPAMEVFSGNW